MMQTSTNKVSNILHGLSGFLLYLFAIYSNVVLLYIHNAYYDDQATIIIILFIVDLVGLIGLFRIEGDMLEKKYNNNLSSFICLLVVFFSVLYVPRGFSYNNVYNKILSDDNHPSNYDALYVNLIISTLLHSLSVILHFISSIVNIYNNEKCEEIQINNI